MPQQVIEYRCLLISPGDVLDERVALIETVNSWNAQIGIGLGARLELVRWESHATPDMAAAPQAVINSQLLDSCDLGIAVFWSRLGTATIEYPSGSVEEVYKLIQKGARVLVYFSSRPIPQESLRDDQYSKLQQIRQKFEDEGLLATYSDTQNLREQAQLHLTNVMTQLLSKDRGVTTYIPASGTLTAPTPDVRVQAHAGVLALSFNKTAELLIVNVENHSTVVVYLQSMFLELKTNEWFYVKDSITGEPISPQALNPGQSISLHISPEELLKFKSKGFICAVARDEIGRVYRSSEAELQSILKVLLKD